MNNTDKLLPCPLCGESEKLLIEQGVPTHADSYVHCFTCGCKGPLRMPDNHIEAWNTRANESEIAELAKQRDELKAENEKLRGIKPSLESTQWPLPRYGIKWNGPKEPLAVPMDDGYWTPFHLAEALSTQEANK